MKINILPKVSKSNLPEDFDQWLERVGGLDKLLQQFGDLNLEEEFQYLIEDFEGWDDLTDEGKSDQLDVWAYERLEGKYYDLKEEHDYRGSRFTIYRTLSLLSIKSVKTKGFGIFWSWDPNSAEAHWGGGVDNGDDYTFTAEVTNAAVDWDQTLIHNLDFWLGEDEKEITLKEGAPITITGWMEGKPRFGKNTWKAPRPEWKTVTASESAWTTAENVRPGDWWLRPGPVFTVSDVRREGDEVVVYNGRVPVRRMDPKDEVAVQKKAARDANLQNLKNYLTMSPRQQYEVYAETFFNEWFDWANITPDEASDGHLREFFERTYRIMKYETPEECPAWMYLTYKREVKNGWVAHFSNHAASIAENGFTHGVADINQLGLTFSIDKESKQGGGYNFGFPLNSSGCKFLNTNWLTAIEGYGDGLVLCRVDYIAVHHETDNHEQAIFVGSDVKETVPVDTRADGGWSIKGQIAATFEEMVTIAKGKPKKAAKQVEGADLLVQSGRVAVYQPKTVQAYLELSQGTSWDSANEHWAQEMADDQETVYVFFMDGQPYAEFLQAKGQVKDRKDKDMTFEVKDSQVIYPEHEYLEKFVLGMRQSPVGAHFKNLLTYLEALQQFKDTVYLSDLVREVPFIDALTYAEDILETGDPEGIAQLMAEMADPWPEGEQFFEQDPRRFDDASRMEFLVKYCLKARKSRWEAFEFYLRRLGTYPEIRQYGKLHNVEADMTDEDWGEWTSYDFTTAFTVGLKDAQPDQYLLKYLRTHWDKVVGEAQRWQGDTYQKFSRAFRAYVAKFDIPLKS